MPTDDGLLQIGDSTKNTMVFGRVTSGTGVVVTNTPGLIAISLAQQSGLTAQLTGITHTEPDAPDYAIQDLVLATGYGFVTADEAQTVLSVIKNLQVRVDELETKIQAYGLLT